MYKYSMQLAGLAALLSLLVAVPVFALEGRVDIRVAPGERPEPRQILQRIIGERQDTVRPQPAERPEGRVVSLGGKVASVGSESFSLEIPSNRERATTTITVVTMDSTEFKIGREDGSFSDVSIGSFAVATGAYATSTQTLTARKVDIASSTPPRGLEVREEVHDRIEARLGDGFFARIFASTTPSENIRGFFLRADTSIDTGENQSGFIRSVFQRFSRLFGR